MKSTKLGQIASISRYPVKSMAGIDLECSMLGWHGLAGDRRFGVRQFEDTSGFPWISASKLPELLLYHPCKFDESCNELSPTRVQTPTGEILELQGDQLRDEIAARVGSDIELMRLKHGIFDDAPVSLIASATISRICNSASVAVDPRRFRSNIVISLDESTAFAEDNWVGCVVSFGGHESHASIHVTKRDVRCKMIGLDPDTGEHNTSIVKASVELNGNHAGVYGTVVSTGKINVGDPVYLLDHLRSN